MRIIPAEMIQPLTIIMVRFEKCIIFQKIMQACILEIVTNLDKSCIDSNQEPSAEPNLDCSVLVANVNNQVSVIYGFLIYYY